jgi:hypothetical protein
MMSEPKLGYDFRGYLAKKAEAVGCSLLTEHYAANADRVTFILRQLGAKKCATISVSGLEEIQNSNLESIQNLLDSRFAKALAAMEAGDNDAGNG